MGGAHKKRNNAMSCLLYQKIEKMYKISYNGYTKNRKIHSTTEWTQIRQQKYYISNSFWKRLFSIDTEFFTPSPVYLYN